MFVILPITEFQARAGSQSLLQQMNNLNDEECATEPEKEQTKRRPLVAGESRASFDIANDSAGRTYIYVICLAQSIN